MNREKLYQQAWFQPLLPALRLFKRELTSTYYLPQLWQEEQASRNWLQKQGAFSRSVEWALRQVRKNKGYFSGWALARSALRSLTGCLFQDRADLPRLVEFGSGQSTRFWQFLSIQMPLSVISVEHQDDWFQRLKAELKNNPAIAYLQAPLRQISEAEKAELWQDPQMAHLKFTQMGQLLPLEQYPQTRVPLCFYDLDYAATFSPDSLDALLLDGPNGNGRSLAFALMYPFLKANAWILVDDFDHYPFLDDLGKLCPFELKHVQIQAGKRWCLLQLQKPQA